MNIKRGKFYSILNQAYGHTRFGYSSSILIHPIIKRRAWTWKCVLLTTCFRPRDPPDVLIYICFVAENMDQSPTKLNGKFVDNSQENEFEFLFFIIQDPQQYLNGLKQSFSLIRPGKKKSKPKKIIGSIRKLTLISCVF